MKLYRTKIPAIAKKIIESLCEDGSIEVAPENGGEAELDLVAIMEEYLRRDGQLREAVREHMADHSVPYNQYGKIRSRLAGTWGHPLGADVERYIARQIVENFMISRFIEEVYSEDKAIYRATQDLLCAFSIDEQALRDEAHSKILNVKEGTIAYEIALSKAIKEVKLRHGLLLPRRPR